jgi:uncharacterized protein YprB with RNaseH-like and TPR domain
MSTLDRLRRLHQVRPQRTEREPEPLPPSPAPQQEQISAPAIVKPQRAGKLETLMPGEVIENGNGLCYVVTERYPLHTQRGDQPLAHLLDHHPSTFAAFHPAFGLQAGIDFRQAVFLDTETTGLGGGAGVYCFMVGVGTFEEILDFRSLQDKFGILDSDPLDNLQSKIAPKGLPPKSKIEFVVRQFFMRHPGEEGALLQALVELLEGYGMSVTFNGRTFDLPLLRTRLRQNQQIYPELRGSGRLLQPEKPHLDLLHPARRLWKRRLQSCRLINLEAEILGMQRSEEDVPGQLIPQLYTDYVQSGNASELRRIFYHNREDIVSMVSLAAQLSRLYQGTAAAEGATLHGLDWFSLGRCHEERGQMAEAERAYHEAVARLHGNAAQAEVFRQLGQLLKRQARWDEAATIWQQWLTTVTAIDATPYEELAKYCEWQCKDFEQAAMWTGWALHTLRTAPAWQQSSAHITELEHRLARLQRKQQTISE